MKITNIQKKYILKHLNKSSAKKMTDDLNVPIEEIEKIIKENKNSNVHRWFYFVLFIIPLVFLITLEIALRIFSYGGDEKEWINLSEKIEILNPDISYRYFTGIKNIPFSTESFLLKDKPDNSFRVIALGASSGAGYPYQNSASFTKYIRRGLELEYPLKRIEVANISMAAVNSFTILDLLPGVLEKKPDLILIYLGHNEYYGALGAGSNQSFGSSLFLTNLMLKINRFKTVKLLKNLITVFASEFKDNDESKDGTLMAKVAGEKLIEINSKVYENGLNQFESNLRDIFSQCREKGVPVIIGTLASNVKDLPPFNSIDDSKYPAAKEVYRNALNLFSDNKFNKADSMFTYAKDLDGLRFRAPEAMNEIISKLASEYKFNVAEVNEALKSASGNKIIGNELMTDHLHPNVLGYQIIGRTFLREMRENKFLPGKKQFRYDLEKLDSIIKSDYNFTKYDSTIADFRIKILKNDWPFKLSSQSIQRESLLNVHTIEGRIAVDVLDGRLSRQDARLQLADNYLKNKNYFMYTEEIIALTDEFPLQNNFCNDAAKKLLQHKEYSLSKKLLMKSYNLEHDEFNSKWLGIINLSQNNFGEAINYLEVGNVLSKNDPQILYNLSAAYSGIKSYKKALELINQCISISPQYANASNIKLQLENIINK